MHKLKWVGAQNENWRLVKVGELWYVERKSVGSWVPSEGIKTMTNALLLYNKMLRRSA